ncbi:Ubiquitin fusion degradation protein 4, partial [Tulasnella sp. 427]
MRRTTRATGTAVTASGIVINEPPRDPKGKKRAVPEPESDEERQSHPPPPLKKGRPSTSNAASSSTPTYSLRPRKTASKTSLAAKSPMAKKSKSTTKSKPSNSKAKASAAGSSSAVRDDDDVEMRDGEAGSGDDYDEHDENDNHGDDDDDESHDEVMEDGASAAPPSSDAPPANPLAEPSSSSGGQPSGLGGLEEGAAAALFGSDFRSIGSYMMTLSSRLKTILENIKPKASPTTRLIALQELAELLSISTEDTLSGYFSIDSFVKELVRIMGGTGNTDDGDDGDDNEEENPDIEQDEDAALAAALALSTGGMPGEESLEAQMLACRCLANLMEALPGCAHTVVYHGAVPVLCSKLIEIQYIDLAEQTLSTLEKISEEYPSAIVREGGLSALLNYLDFFSTNVQRTALQAASN